MDDVAESPGMCSNRPGTTPKVESKRDGFESVWLGFGGGRESPLTI